MKSVIKPKDLLHELEQGERIEEDVKKMLMKRNSPSTFNADNWNTTSVFATSSIYQGPYET